ncbi:MAG: peptide ABC transporter substrate-binding protein, partial [Planctomycetes bacterium]|nr:peptide ABC transporter substrate-binding protein [Planctomycetota bacterium]
MSTINRRRFMGTTAAGALALASPMTFAAGPKRGGTMRIAMAHGNTVDTYDPAVWNNAFMQFFSYSRCGYLTEILPNGSLNGELLESWEASADASTWTLKLRKGMEFHNGKTVTAEDVIASLRYHQGEETKSAAKPIVAPIKDMKAPDAHTVVLSLEGGNADLPFVLSD